MSDGVRAALALFGPWLIVPFSVRNSTPAARSAVTSLFVAPPAGVIGLLFALGGLGLPRSYRETIELFGILLIGFVYAYVLVGGWATLLGALGGRLLARFASLRRKPAPLIPAGMLGGAFLGIVPIAALRCAAQRT